MLNIDRALGDDRLIKAVTGLSASEFNELVGRFREEFQNFFQFEARVRYETGVEMGNRERKPGGGRIGNLGSYATKLFFTLFYFKCYPTFDILGFLFDLNRSNANRNIHKLASIRTCSTRCGKLVSSSLRCHTPAQNKFRQSRHSISVREYIPQILVETDTTLPARVKY